MPEPEAKGISAEQLRSLILLLARRSEAGLRGLALRGRDQPEALHDLHRDLRSLRVGFAIWPRAKDSAAAQPSAARNLRRVARLVGEVRDRDVAMGLLFRPRSGARPHAVALSVSRKLEQEARVGRELLRSVARAELRDRLFDRVALAVTGAPSPRPSRLARSLESHRVLRQRKLDRALRRALRKPKTRRMHRLRIALRNARTLHDLSGRVRGGPPPPMPPKLRSLQTELGQLHDLDLLDARLRSLPASKSREGWISSLRTQRRNRRRRILEQLRRRKVQSAMRSLLPRPPSRTLERKL
jgi:CHAD domain-containing protein